MGRIDTELLLEIVAARCPELVEAYMASGPFRCTHYLSYNPAADSFYHEETNGRIVFEKRGAILEEFSRASWQIL